MDGEESSFKSSPEYGFKQTIIYSFLVCLREYQRISDDLFLNRKPTNWPRFKSKLLALYLLLAPKLDYQKGYSELKELEPIMRNLTAKRFELSDEKSLQYFFLMRELIEKLGITKSEWEEVPRGEGLVSALGE